MLPTAVCRLERFLFPSLTFASRGLVARQLSTPPVGDPHDVHQVRHPDMQKEFRGRKDNFPCLARFETVSSVWVAIVTGNYSNGWFLPSIINCC